MIALIDPTETRRHDAPDGLPGDEADRSDLAAVATGDAAALERLYGRHRGALYPFIRRYLGDRQLAEEALQDTMVAVWNQADTFRGDSLVRTWIFSIARFKALGIARRRTPEPVDTATDDHRWHRTDTTLDPERLAIERDRLERVGEAIDALPPDQRECFLLAVAGHLGYAEIATILGVEVGTVKSRVARARRALAALRHESTREQQP